MKIAKCRVAYKRINGEVPLYIEDSLRLNSQQYSSVTRYSKINFICPKFNQVTEGGRSFSVSPCQLWNSLSLELRNAVSLYAFACYLQVIILFILIIFPVITIMLFFFFGTKSQIYF